MASRQRGPWDDRWHLPPPPAQHTSSPRGKETIRTRAEIQEKLSHEQGKGPLIHCTHLSRVQKDQMYGREAGEGIHQVEIQESKRRQGMKQKTPPKCSLGGAGQGWGKSESAMTRAGKGREGRGCHYIKSLQPPDAHHVITPLGDDAHDLHGTLQAGKRQRVNA